MMTGWFDHVWSNLDCACIPVLKRTILDTLTRANEA